MRFRIPAALVLTATVGCIGKAEIDPNETKDKLNATPASQDYNPANSVIPFPNILLLDAKTGLNDLPATCGESATSAGLRTEVLNTLDGVGTWLPAIYATFTAQVDLTTATDSTVVLTKVVADPTTATRVPIVVSRFQTLRYPEALPECGEASVVEGIVITPKIPLDDNAEYVVGVQQGVKDTSGDEFQPSSAWFFSRQNTSPVEVADKNGNGVIDTPDEVVVNNTPLNKYDGADLNGNGIPDVLETLAGIAQLSQLNHQFLPFTEAALSQIQGTSVTADDLLIAWAFKTQTVKAPLDPAAQHGPATHIGENITFGLAVAASGAAVGPTIEGSIGKPGFCTVAPCAAIGTIFEGQYVAQNYQVPGPNTGVLTGPVPGPWASPLDPTQATGPVALNVVATMPAGTMPAGGWPLVVFGHGLQSQKGASLVIAPSLAAAGIATIAVDWPLHGDRAVQIYPKGTGCESASDPSTAPAANFNYSPNCFAQILSANLPATRDNFRQGVIDVMRMITSVKATCASGSTTVATACAGFDIDTSNIGYLGQSLGSLLGGMDVAMDPDIKAAVLNVPAVSLITILENTDTNTIKCPLIDALINNGTLTGKLWQQPDGTFNNTDALCIQNDTTKPIPIADPASTSPQHAAYEQFATAARWVLDPADSVNFIGRLAARVKGGTLALMLQEVQGDAVLPNEATYFLGAFLGLTAPTTAADPAAFPPAPTTGVDATSGVLQWLQYVTDAAAKYAHPSLLAPADSSLQSQAGTAQMQVDAVTFLATHLHPAH